jgi:hypothetical protein
LSPMKVCQLLFLLLSGVLLDGKPFPNGGFETGLEGWRFWADNQARFVPKVQPLKELPLPYMPDSVTDGAKTGALDLHSYWDGRLVQIESEQPPGEARSGYTP